MEMDVLICFYQSVQVTIALKVLCMFTPVAGWVNYALDPDKEITNMLSNDYWLHGLHKTSNFSCTELNIYLSGRKW